MLSGPQIALLRALARQPVEGRRGTPSIEVEGLIAAGLAKGTFAGHSGMEITISEAGVRALAEARRKLAEARQAETVRYRIRPGDTLWDLARTFLGDGRRWPEILRANHSRITDPDRLLIGQVVDIPLGSGH